MDLKYENGLIEIKVEGDSNGKAITPQQFKLPLKIEVRAKTDSAKGRLSIKYAKGEAVFN